MEKLLTYPSFTVINLGDLWRQTYLLFLAVLALDAVVHAHLAHKLLAQKVADLDEGAALRDGAVDGEMGVDGAHLVLVALNEGVHTYAARIKRSLAATTPRHRHHL